MKYARRFFISFIAGAGSAIGAFVGKECMVMVKNEYKRNEKKCKKKVKTTKEKHSKEEES